MYINRIGANYSSSPICKSPPYSESDAGVYQNSPILNDTAQNEKEQMGLFSFVKDKCSYLKNKYNEYDDYRYNQRQAKLDIQDKISIGDYDLDGDGSVSLKDFQILLMPSSKDLDNIRKDEKLLKIRQLSNGVNKEIDYFEQGDVADCWLLASLESLSNSARGRKLISNFITKNKDDSYTVNLKGLKQKIIVTQQELNDGRNRNIYSRGDDDVLLMELAFEKYRDKVQRGEVEPDKHYSAYNNLHANSSLNGGTFSQVIYAMTGDNPDFKTNDKKNIDKLLEKIEDNPKNFAATITFASDSDEDNDIITVKDVNGNDVPLTFKGEAHCWSIKSVRNGNVTMVNPWKSSQEFTVNKKEIKKYAKDIEYYKFKKYSSYKNLKEKVKEFLIPKPMNMFIAGAYLYTISLLLKSGKILKQEIPSLMKKL